MVLEQYTVDRNLYEEALGEGLPESVDNRVAVDKCGYSAAVADELGADYLDRRIMIFGEEQASCRYDADGSAGVERLVDRLYEEGQFLTDDEYSGVTFIEDATALGPIVLEWDVELGDELELYAYLKPQGAASELGHLQELAGSVRTLSRADVEAHSTMTELADRVNSLEPEQRQFFDLFYEDDVKINSRPIQVSTTTHPATSDTDIRDIELPFTMPAAAFESLETTKTTFENISGTLTSQQDIESIFGDLNLVFQFEASDAWYHDIKSTHGDIKLIVDESKDSRRRYPDIETTHGNIDILVLDDVRVKTEQAFNETSRIHGTPPSSSQIMTASTTFGYVTVYYAPWEEC